MIGDLQDNTKWRHGNLLVNGCCVTQSWKFFNARTSYVFDEMMIMNALYQKITTSWIVWLTTTTM